MALSMVALFLLLNQYIVVGDVDVIETRSAGCLDQILKGAGAVAVESVHVDVAAVLVDHLPFAPSFTPFGVCPQRQQPRKPGPSPGER